MIEKCLGKVEYEVVVKEAPDRVPSGGFEGPIVDSWLVFLGPEIIGASF